MSFENFDLHPTILKAVRQCGYTTPTPIQSEGIPKVLEGSDIIASANTGTGKTATFVLPALQRFTKRRFKKLYGKPSVLILTPTRELATQVSQAIRNYGKNLRFSSVILVGGMPYEPQLRSLSRQIDIVVATPGRLLDLITRRNVDLSHVNMLVLDEADRMLDMGFVDEVNKIANFTPNDRQTLLFTATWDENLARLAHRLLNEPERIKIETQYTQKNIEQRLHVADNFEHKNRLLQHLLDDDELTQAIIFSATKIGADTLAQDLKSQGYAAAALHGDMKQGARNRTLTNMRRGKLRLLVATDVAARGIDLTSVSHVINFDLPRFAEDYVHRIGRTGRAGANGTAISFALPDDGLHLDRIERFTKQQIPQYEIEGLEPTRTLRRNRPKKRKPRENFSAKRKGGYYNGPPKGKNRSQHQPPPHHRFQRRQGGSAAKKVGA
ncbi:DEAD/DEAH box helicase [Candidatus Parabeggiatoa sp. HSG14]|uniref:DEAD/DEAH box helicase n=1 Tax=Candidatus Parabeggiatoa sp. HSG14 TaxID=3055593 RepID=UPI0025A81F03|nr:DEAD/DEAH box helicase [Thiotrichales bacterium HSG14]